MVFTNSILYRLLRYFIESDLWFYRSVAPWFLFSSLWYQNTPNLQRLRWLYSLEVGVNIIHPARMGNWSAHQMKWFSRRKEVCDCSTRNWLQVFLVPGWHTLPQTILLMPRAPALDLSLGSKTLCANDSLLTQAWGLHNATLLNKSLICKTCSREARRVKKKMGWA